MYESMTTRHLLAAERALLRVVKSMEMAERRGEDVDLSTGWKAQEELSLCLQAERFKSEDRDERTAVPYA